MDISDTVRSARSAALAQALSNGTLEIRTGSAPANCAAKDVGECIASFQLASVSVKGPDIVIVSAPLQGHAKYEGAAGHYRVYGSGGVIMQGPAGGPGADLNIGAAAIKKGQLVEIQSWVVTDL